MCEEMIPPVQETGSDAYEAAFQNQDGVSVTPGKPLLFVNRFFHWVFDRLTALNCGKRIIESAPNATIYIGVACYGLALFCLTFGIVQAIHFRAIAFLWTGLGLAAASLVAPFFAEKLIGGTYLTLRNFTTKLPSMNFLHSLAALFLILSVVELLAGFAVGGMMSILIGVGVSVLCGIIAILVLSPEALSITIEPAKTSPAEELIAVLTCFLKAVISLISYIWGVLVLIAFIMVIRALFTGNDMEALTMSATLVGSVALVTLLPLASYLFVLLYLFVIDLARSILSIPGKLDQLKEADGKQKD